MVEGSQGIIEHHGNHGSNTCASAPRRPGHTPLTAFAPLSSGTKGAWIPACAGMTEGTRDLRPDSTLESRHEVR